MTITSLDPARALKELERIRRCSADRNFPTAFERKAALVSIDDDYSRKVVETTFAMVDQLRRDDWRETALQLLLAPYMDPGVRQMVQTSACARLDHPAKWEGWRDCVCGMHRYPPDEEAT